MKHSTIGLLAAWTVTTGAAFAAPGAIADETEAPEARSAAAAEPARASRHRASDAHREAVAKAAEAVVSAARLDLDIRLVSHTSMQVANDLR